MARDLYCQKEHMKMKSAMYDSTFKLFTRAGWLLVGVALGRLTYSKWHFLGFVLTFLLLLFALERIGELRKKATGVDYVGG